MRRKIVPTRLIALLLAAALFVGNDYTLYPLAEVAMNSIGLTDAEEPQGEPVVVLEGDTGTQGTTPSTEPSTTPSANPNATPTGPSTDDPEIVDECPKGGYHAWIEIDAVTGEHECSKCGDTMIVTTETTPVEGEGEGGSDNKCIDDEGHVWNLIDAESGKYHCDKCGKDGILGEGGNVTPGEGDVTPGEDNNNNVCPIGGEHDWVDYKPETDELTCSKCGEYKKHGQNHNWEFDPDIEGDRCSICGKPKSQVECEHDWIYEPKTDEVICSNCGAREAHGQNHNWEFDSDIEGDRCSICGKPRSQVECEHEWGSYDPKKDKVICIKCLAEKDCEHEWVFDEDAGEERCRICNKLRSQAECEHEWGSYDPKKDKVICIKCLAEKDCEHEWVFDEDAGEERCRICNKLRSQAECDHDWVEDPETGRMVCSKCGMEMPCEHEWIRDPETLEVVCSICGEFNEEFVEDECPESPWGFHVYEEKEDGTGYVCVLCGVEKEELDPLDITLEMFLNSQYGFGFSLLSMEKLEDPTYEDYESSYMPKTVEELNSRSNKTLVIECLGDLLVLQELSRGVGDKGTDFAGFTLQFATRMTGPVEENGTTSFWNLTDKKINGIEGKIKGRKIRRNEDGTPVVNSQGKPMIDTLTFEGLGSEEHPFRGTVETGLDGINFTLQMPLFRYLDVEATIGTPSWDVNINGAISGTYSEQPVGILAGILVKEPGDTADCVTLNRVSLDGSVSETSTTTGSAAGLIFGRVEAKEDTSIVLPYDNTNIKLGNLNPATVSGHHAGGFAGETLGNVTVHIKDSGIIHNVMVSSLSNVTNNTTETNRLTWAASAGGTFVGAMKAGTLRIDGNSEAYKVNVRGSGYNGGFVGIATEGTEVTTAKAEDGSPVSIATVSGGGYTTSSITYGVYGQTAGGILGYYEHPADMESQLLKLEDINMSANVYGYNYIAGGVLGRYYRNITGKADGITDDTIDYVTATNTVRAGQHAGGVVGYVNGSNLVIGGAGDAKNGDYSINISGTKFATYTAGGVVGMITGRYVEIQNATIGVNVYGSSPNAYYGGGVVGTVGRSNTDTNKTIIKISDVNITNNVGGAYGSRYRGGLLGYVFSGCMVALDGDIKLTSLGTTSYWGMTGHIAGGQNQGLIYLETDANYTRPSQSAPAASPSDNAYYYDDIGSYGGVYRNGSWGENQDLFSYENFTVNGTVGKSGDVWQIDSEADFIRLAIMLNSEGAFASGSFPGASKANLLAAEYKVTKSLNLADSGVYCLNRNDYTGFSTTQTFTGKFTGAGSNTVTINLGDLKTRQRYLSLFPRVGKGAEISGFTLKRTIYGTIHYAAGIAAYSEGDFTAKDLYINLTPADEGTAAYGLKGYDSSTSSRYYYETVTSSSATSWGGYGASWSYYSTNQYYAGLVAYADASGNTKFTVEDVRINGWLSADNYYNGSSYYGFIYIGGMVAYYNQGTSTATSTISVKNFELMDKFRADSAHAYRISGMITELNTTNQTVSETQVTQDRTILSMQNIKVHNGAQITATGSTTYQCGGWLGREWRNIIPDKDAHYSISGITIGDGGSYSEGPYYTSGHYFGGLVETVAGRIQLQNIDIANGVFNNASTRTGIGLLFRIGNNAIIEIDGYRIDGRDIGDTTPNNSGNVRVNNCGVTIFDEIVAYNIGTSTSGDYDYKTGGIVNIIYNDFSNGATAGHKVYQNRLLTPRNNRKTRYYYNLFGNTFAGEDSYLAGSKLTLSGPTITNEKEIMIWHLSQYMNASIRRFLAPYYDGDISSSTDPNIGRNANATFSGNINLNTVSYYPTPVCVYPVPGTNAPPIVAEYNFVNGATITFYGEDITNKAGLMSPSDNQREHYMMHAGLFLSKEGTVTVKGDEKFLTLKGSITFLPADDKDNSEPTAYRKNLTGALFTRDITGKKSIYRVKFDGLYVAGYAAMPATSGNSNNDPTGLMIAIVKDNTTLDISWIETTGYDNFSGNAASALIGLVGDVEAKKISIEFKNMKLDSRKGSIFRYASFIDEHYYVEDTQEQSKDIRRVRYLFTKDAFYGTDGSSRTYSPFDGTVEEYGNNDYSEVGSYVTVGYELGEGIEYWDVNYGPQNEPDGNKTFNLPWKNNFTWSQDNVESSYIPYVHKEVHTSSKDIEVNPKNKSITEGCGTYEDPYIINDPKQLLALARYLQNKDDYKYLEHWQVREYQSGRLNYDETDNTCHHRHKKYVEGQLETADPELKTYIVRDGVPDLSDFPTQEELSQAYYMITKDVDLTDMWNATDRVIAEDFAGLGTKEIPFRGVIIGKYAKADDIKNDENRPKITFPLKSNWLGSSGDMNSGLIQYAMGAVVKDLRISSANNKDDNGNRIKKDKTEVAKVKKMAGGVMADVLGGDNIIDNVSVNIKFAVQDNTCTAGAYVGTVEQGSLILRNLHEDCASGFEVGQWNTGTNELYNHGTVAGYIYVSGLIGKVEDGCVIYDDTTGTGATYGKSVLDHEKDYIPGIYKHQKIEGNTASNNVSLPISDHYDIIVKSHLDAEAAGGNRIVVKKATISDPINGDDGGMRTHFTAELNSSSHLQIVSMLINSDAFSVTPDKGGYSKKAACRKADYSYVGDVIDASGNVRTDDAGTDFKSARDNDDEVHYYPYLYQYFNFDGSVGGYTGTLNLGTTTRKRGGKGQPDATITIATSKLNMATKNIDEIMDYKLANGDGNQEYDLAQYCRGFRGIGATYGMWDVVTPASSARRDPYDQLNENVFYSDFRANFDGNNAIIILGIDRGYDPSIHTSALFNDLMDQKIAGKYYYTIENIRVTGRVTSVVYNYDTDGKATSVNTLGTSSSYPNRTGTIAGLMRRPWKLSNITVYDMTVEGKGNTGGLVAWVEPDTSLPATTVAHNTAYEFEKCSLEGDTKVHAYSGSVGGMIGIVAQNQGNGGAFTVSMDLKGCTVIGKPGSPMDIAVMNRTRDYFDGSSSSSSDYSVQRGVGRSGGLIGYIGKKFNSANDPTVTVNIVRSDDNTRSGVSNANIIGAYSTGGLIGAYCASTDVKSKVNIEDALVQSCEIDGQRSNCSNSDLYYTYGVGGLIGEMRGYWMQMKGTEGIEVLDTNINASESTSTPNYRGYGMYTGGIVGCLKTANQNVFENVSVAENDVNNKLGGQKHIIRSSRSDVGGMIGRAVLSGSSTLDMKGVKVSGMYITADKRTMSQLFDKTTGTFKYTFDTTSGTGGYVGGLIGTNQLPLTISGTNATDGSGATVEKCMITADRYDVGGIVGMITEQTNSQPYNTNYWVRSTNIQDVLVTDSIIGYNNTNPMSGNGTTYGAGGIYGKIDSSWIYSSYGTRYNSSYLHRLENTRIEDCWIYGPLAGGVLGYGMTYERLYSNGLDIKNTSSTKKGLIVQNNKIYGTYVGGIIGRGEASRVNYIGTQVKGNYLQAYGSSTTGSVGGFVGYATDGSSGSTNSDYRLDGILIEDNKLFAGNTATNENIAAGGLFGYTTWAHCYIYEPEIKDNLIGYSETASMYWFKQSSDTSIASTALLDTLFGSGKEMDSKTTSQLLVYESSAFKGVDMPDVNALRSDKIGYYAGRIGNLIGQGVYGKDAHIYILAPKISYKADIGTRPVIDVGMVTPTAAEDTTRLLGSPYAYRSNIHVIYYEPESTAVGDAAEWNKVSINNNTGGDNWKSLFSGIDYRTLVTKYRNSYVPDSSGNYVSNDLSEYLEAYRLNVVADYVGGQYVANLYRDLYDNGGLKSNAMHFMAGNDVVLPAIVLDTQYGTADELMKGVIAALTGAGGVYSCDEDNVYSSGMYNITDIQTKRMVIVDKSRKGDTNDYLTGRSVGEIITEPDSNKAASLSVDKTGNKYTLNYNDFDEDGLDYDQESTPTKPDYYRTFTMLTITYGWDYTPVGTGATLQQRSKTINIPVFVVERLNIDTHMKIVEGLQYNAQSVHDNGRFSNDVVVANDSSYTLYMEYIYGRSRTKYTNTAIPKSIGFNQVISSGGIPKGFAPGTKLTLIDVDNNNKVYYYTVTEADRNRAISFTDFMSESSEDNSVGEQYQNKDISMSSEKKLGDKNAGFMVYDGKEVYETEDMPMVNSSEGTTYEYTNVAIERFLITVDISGVAEENFIEASTRKVDNKLRLEGRLKAKTTLGEHTDLELRILEGIKIKFYQTDKPATEPKPGINLEDPEETVENEVTWIEGEITADEDHGFVDIWGTIRISANQLYWREVRQGTNIIDSANHNKFLELQVYLTHEGQTDEIMLPSGTFVSIEGTRTAPAKSLKDYGVTQEESIDRTSLDPYYDASNIYFYKDGKLIFDMKYVSEIIEAEYKRNKLDPTLEIRWADYLRLDFRNAEMMPFDQEWYDVHIDLLRIENPDYPASGQLMDSYVRTLDAQRPEDLACALEAKDLMQLGINTYDKQADLDHLIDFDYKMDFNGVMTGQDETDKELADKHYTVAYRLWEKEFADDGESYVYVPYNGDELELTLVNDPGDQLNKANEKKLTLAQSKDGVKFWWTDYKFNWKEIKYGTKMKDIEIPENNGSLEGGDSSGIVEGAGVITRPLQLTVKDAYAMDLSNYKVQVILYVSDDDGSNKKPVLKVEDINLDADTTLSDFFVFTVAKLKTDLDY